MQKDEQLLKQQKELKQKDEEKYTIQHADNEYTIGKHRLH